MADEDPADQPDQDEERESIWSVRKEDLAWYSVLFPVLWLIGTVYYTVTIFLRHENFADAIDMLIVRIGVTGLSSAVLSLMIIAGKRGLVMPLFNWYADREAKRKQRSEQDRQRGLAEGRSEGRSEGLAEGRVEGRVEGRAEGRVEGRVEGRAEGIAEANAQWEAWNARREVAAANGGGFDEPPPSQSGESRDYH